MNTKDNKRHQETLQRGCATFDELLREQELNKLFVTALCEDANIDRSTFCGNFEDISALANACAAEIEMDLKNQPEWQNSALIYGGEVASQDALGNINYGFFDKYCNFPNSV